MNNSYIHQYFRFNYEVNAVGLYVVDGKYVKIVEKVELRLPAVHERTQAKKLPEKLEKEHH